MSTTLTFNPITYGNVSFTNISITETDTGTVASLSNAPGSALGVSTSIGPGVGWQGIHTGVYYANSSEVLNFNYTVTAGAGSLLSSAGQLYISDAMIGPGVHLAAVENIYSTSGALLATESYNQLTSNPASVALSTPAQSVNVHVTLTMSIDSTGTSSSEVLISAIEQYFKTVAAPTNTASIGDIVFYDSTGSGLESGFDSGPGVPGVTVELLNGTGTSVLAVTTTDANGLYNFSGLAAGVYEVKFVSPDGYSFTTEGVGNNPGVNSSANQTTGVTAPITLTAGQADHNVEAGLVTSSGAGAGGSAALGEVVWLDSNHDGILDNGEKGVSGVTVELLNGTGTSVLATTTTDSTGHYQFTNLAPGSYDVQFITPSGYAYTTQNVATPGINSVADSTGHTAPVTLTAGQVDDDVNAGLVNTGAIGDIVWMDTNKDGLLDNCETGVAGVTVELLNGNGTSVLATTTTNAAGNYEFTGLAAGVYEVKFLSPTGDTFTTQGVGNNPAINSSPSVSTGVTAPITLAAGQIDNNVEAGLQQTSGISVLKVPCDVVVNQCGQETYTFYVTNTGSTALTNVKIVDNIGTAANPDNVVPTLVTQDSDGILQAGQTWVYTETINQIGCTSLKSGSVCHTATGSHLGSGSTAWLSSSFNPTSCANGATYKFQGVTCTIQGSGTGGRAISVDCPDSVVTFSSSCKQATTVYDSDTNCWVTTLPANCNPGSVFLSGCPTTVPGGYNFSNCSVTWNIGDASNNCGASSINWDGSCTGYSSFSQNGCNGSSDYNQIGVKSCDNLSGYGSGGNCNVGYGWDGSSYCNTGYNGYGGGYGTSYNNTGWQGSGSDNCGTPENQYTGSNCGNTSNCSSGSGSSGSTNYWDCGSGGNNSGSCDGNGSASQNCGPTAGAADTVTVTAQTVVAAGHCTTTASGGNLSSGCTAWLSSSFKPTSCGNGATYNFKGITCTITGSNGSPITIDCPDARIVFSNNCSTPSTVFDASSNCWVTTLPANCSPGNVFLSGCPLTIPSGCNLSGATVNWSIGSSTNNCGASSVNWQGACTGYDGFNANGCNGQSDYNQIGVKSCDNLSGYGNGGSTNIGYGWNGTGYCDYGYNSYGGGSGYNSYGYNSWGGRSYGGNNDDTHGWIGSSNNAAGTPENEYTSGNCGQTSSCTNSTSPGSTCTSTTTPVTVTASDTKEVEVLGCNSNISVDGTVPTGVLSSLYGAAKTLEFVYNPGNTVSLGQNQSGMASVNGSNTLNTAYMVIRNASGSSIYFEGAVTAGELIYADAALNPLTNTAITNGQFSTTAGAGIVAQVYTSQAAFLAGSAATQTMNYNTSGSQAMHLGDTVGSLQLQGYVGTKGGHLVDDYVPTTTTTTGGQTTNGGDTLTVNLSENAYQGDAQFTVSVDGHQVGGVMTASALQSTGDSNVFVLTGNWGSGAQQVAISFINDCYDGTSSTDRNLYVNSIAYDGKTYAGTSASMLSSGTNTFTVGGNTASAATPADTLALFLSEDAYQGDAQFELFIDGKQVTTAQSVTTLHSSGQSEAFTFSGNFGSGHHTVGVAFLNDRYDGTSGADRNLYVNSISLNGSTVSGSTAAMLSSGTTNVSVFTAH